MKKICSKGIILPVVVAVVSLVVVVVIFSYGISNDNSQQRLADTVLEFFQNKEAIDNGQNIIDNENENSRSDAPIKEVPIPESDNEEELIFCTADAKICPDGSGVGRVPPSCEFAPCPGE